MPSELPNFTQRNRILTVLVLLFGAVIIARLFYVQIIMHDYYEAEATREHVGKFVIRAERGEIYARDGDKIVPLALNEPSYTAYADARYVKDPPNTLTVLRRIAGGNLVGDIDKAFDDKDRQYVVLAKLLNKDQAELIKKESLPGVGLQQAERRVYPEGKLAAQVLGFVNGEAKGQYGVEEGLANELSGTPGLLKAVTDVNGIPISIGQESIQAPAIDGADIVLSIDRNIQAYAEQALGVGLEKASATRGSLLIVNPNNGQVMAMANMPNYDPGDYASTTDFQAFQNGTISDPYEVGSVLKPLSMAMGFNEGVVSPESTYKNTGSVQVADALIKNADNEHLAVLTMREVIKYSYNTGMVHMLKQFGGGEINLAARQKLYQYLTDRYFFGRLTGIPLAGEAAGLVVTPDDAEGGPVRYANMTFGQGMTATMVQEAAAFAAIINGGVYYTPQILAGRLNDDGNISPVSSEVRKSDVVTRDTSNVIRDILQWARGTSVQGTYDKKGYSVGGKSGTAQVYDSATGRYSDTNTIGSYIGYGGQARPEYVIMVRVNDPHVSGFAGPTAAAPIFADMSNWLLDYLKIQPRG